MPNYTKFIGIDIGKFNFVIAIHGQQKTMEYENSVKGIARFLKDHDDILPNSLCVLEATGGYELDLLYALIDKTICVHRADARKVKNFIRSYGHGAKTDRLDAQALAKYGCERGPELRLFEPQSQQELELHKRVQRRKDLTQMIVAEKNRLQMNPSKSVAKSLRKVIRTLEQEIKRLNDEVVEVIQADSVLKAQYRILKEIPGIGKIVGYELLILLPELGNLSRRQIACLAGLAPIAKESGRFKGYRRTGYGRQGIKPMLFIAAMAARNSKSHLREFFEKLIAKGKPKMVALGALMRKILVIANARLRDYLKKEAAVVVAGCGKSA